MSLSLANVAMRPTNAAVVVSLQLSDQHTGELPRHEHADATVHHVHAGRKLRRTGHSHLHLLRDTRHRTTAAPPVEPTRRHPAPATCRRICCGMRRSKDEGAKDHVARDDRCRRLRRLLAAILDLPGHSCRDLVSVSTSRSPDGLESRDASSYVLSRSRLGLGYLRLVPKTLLCPNFAKPH